MLNRFRAAPQGSPKLGEGLVPRHSRRHRTHRHIYISPGAVHNQQSAQVIDKHPSS